eukprot:gene26691-34977_t
MVTIRSARRARSWLCVAMRPAAPSPRINSRSAENTRSLVAGSSTRMEVSPVPY